MQLLWLTNKLAFNIINTEPQQQTPKNKSFWFSRQLFRKKSSTEPKKCYKNKEKQENINTWTEDPVYEEFPVRDRGNAIGFRAKTIATNRQPYNNCENNRQWNERRYKDIMKGKQKRNTRNWPKEASVSYLNAYTVCPCMIATHDT